MRSSKTAFILLVVLIASIFVAKVSNLINTNPQKFQHNDDDTVFKKEIKTLDDSTDHMMWFIQISDIHTSIHKDKARITDLEDFIKTTMTAVKPSVVIVSGDITDARTQGLESAQMKKEWEMYYEVLERTKVLEMTTWLDLRGNHDNFNVPDINSSVNYFQNFSVQGKLHKTSYIYEIEKGGSKFSFIAIDATLKKGLKRQFNFIGILNQNDMDLIQELVDRAKRSNTDHILWFGHYPTSCIITPDSEDHIRTTIGQVQESLVYICGHLHTIGGIVPHMYSLQKEGFLELELGDWKDNRMFRVAVVDHGLFSFTDFQHGKSNPIVIITNPKSAQFRIPGHENPTKKSTHIRILVFSMGKVISCKVRLDNSDFSACKAKTENLYVMKWDPELYQIGAHNIEVEVEDEFGQKEVVSHYFSLDNSNPYKFKFMARFLLMTDFCTIFHVLFFISYALCILPMLTLRIWHELVIRNKIRMPNNTGTCKRACLRRFWLLSSVNRVFWPLMGFYLYFLLGPWFFGQVIDGKPMGVVFLWGLFVDSIFFSGNLQFLYGFFQLLFCQFPLTLIYANIVDRIFRNRQKGFTPKSVSKVRFVWNNLPFFIVMIVEIVLAIFNLISHGPLSFILGPLRTWSIVMHIFLFYQLHNLPPTSLDRGYFIWNSNEAKTSNNRIASS